MKKILSIGALAFLVACGAGETYETTPVAQNPTPEVEQAIEELIDPTQALEETHILITHISGETYVPLNPTRVAVFDMGIWDTMYALGLGDYIIGGATNFLTELVDHFEVINLGTLHEPNLELLIEYEPELVIISGRARPMFEELNSLVPTIDLGISNHAEFIYYFTRNTMAIAQIFGVEYRAIELLAEIDALIKETNELSAQLGEDKQALIVLYNEGQLRAHGPNSRFGIIHDLLGVPYVDGELEIVNHGTLVSNEYVVAYDPFILFVLDRGAVITDGQAFNREDIENELIRLTRAYQNGNIVYLNNAIWYIAPGGLQGVKLQIEEVRDAVLNSLD
ncbi:MAG: ABC transporter substrate-binding protein [Defluviitaleaceae bacterium]|nr:ABC transporter substrate-binding protein [Defluviitaleaceae bacterium]